MQAKAPVQGLSDSTPIAEDGSRLRDRMAEDGVLLFRDWLDVDALRRLRVEMLAELDRCGWLAPHTDPTDAVPGQPLRVEGDPEWWAGYKAVQCLENFHATGHNSQIISMLGALFGEPVLVHPRKIARIIYPQHAEATTPPHQDFPHIGGTVDFFTLWIPLADTPASSGGLRVLPRSHRGGLRELRVDHRVTGGWWMDAPESDQDWAVLDYKVGDAILFHSLTVHAASPNVSDKLRLSLDFRYQPMSEPVAEPNLYPHFPPYSGDLAQIIPWDRLSRDWSSQEWIAMPAGTEVSDAQAVMPTGRIGGNGGRRGGASRFVDTTTFAAQVEAQEPIAIDRPLRR